ncbi:MAG: carboxypeptidase-like regulatory domain-containing protein [Planctomycetota bacterium]|jgi:hypothetical protein
MDWKRFSAPLAIGLLLCTGCGGGDTGREPTFKVTGKVTLAGAPVSKATVTFFPSEGQRSAIGLTDDNGEYLLTTYEFGDGAMSGKYSITINKAVPRQASSSESDHEAIASGKVDPGAEHDADEDDPEASAVPQRYTNPDESGFSAEVTVDGENRFDLAMEP